MPEIVQLNALILGIVVFINLLVAALIIARDFKNSVNRAFFIFIIVETLWVIVRFIDNLYAFYYPGVSVWAQLALLPALFMPFLFFYFVSHFTGDWTDVSLVKKIILISPAIIMSFFLFTVHNIVSYDNYQFKPGSLYIWFSMYFILFVGLTLYLLMRRSLAMASWQRAQARNIFWGSLLAALFGVTFSAVLPLLSFDSFYYIGSMSSAFFSILVFVTITQIVISKD